jgi:hypothetical protein
MPCRRLMHSADPRLETAAVLVLSLSPSCGAPTLGRMKTNVIAGHSVRQSARHHYEQAGLLALLGAALLTVAVLIGANAGGGAGALLCAIGVLVAFEARRQLRLARRFKVGAVSEERVGSRLWALEDRGWLVAQDVEKEGGGNVDHLVQSPAVTFVIETKTARYRERDIEQARRHARWAAGIYGPGREVISLICVQRSQDRPKLVDGVYVVGAPHLVNFLLDRG